MRTWPRTVFRICCTVFAVLIFNQAVFAGQFLGGSFGALHTHRENATVTGIAALVTAVSGLLLQLRGGGPAWPALASLGLFALIAAQIMLGFARLLTVHIPLGVAIIVLTILLTRWSWRSPPAATAEPTDPATAGPADRSTTRATTPPVDQAIARPAHATAAHHATATPADRSTTRATTPPVDQATARPAHAAAGSAEQSTAGVAAAAETGTAVAGPVRSGNALAAGRAWPVGNDELVR